MIKRAALIFGWVFLLVGIMGFIPALRIGGGEGYGYLLGLFAVNSLHNWVHILTGAAALAVGYRSEAASRLPPSTSAAASRPERVAVQTKSGAPATITA